MGDQESILRLECRLLSEEQEDKSFRLAGGAFMALLSMLDHILLKWIAEVKRSERETNGSLHRVLNELCFHFTSLWYIRIAFGHCATSRKVAGSTPDEVN
jgi:hypothetical protein